MAHGAITLAALIGIALAISFATLIGALIHAGRLTAADPHAPPGDVIALAFAAVSSGALGVYALVSFTTAILGIVGL